MREREREREVYFNMMHFTIDSCFTTIQVFTIFYLFACGQISPQVHQYLAALLLHISIQHSLHLGKSTIPESRSFGKLDLKNFSIPGIFVICEVYRK